MLVKIEKRKMQTTQATHAASHISLVKASHMAKPGNYEEGKYSLTGRGSKYFKQ